MKIVGTILLLVMFSGGSISSFAAQRDESSREIAALVSHLSWDSVGGECNGIWRIFPTGEPAKKLVQIGKPATDELLRVLEDADKGVAAHLILSEIWEPEMIVYGSRVEGSEFVHGFIHIYNGLEWEDIINMQEKNVTPKVESLNLMINAATWRLKLAKYRKDAANNAAPNNSFNRSAG